MAHFHQRLKQVTHKDKLIVNGFIREAQDLLPFEDNPYYNLNGLIVQICLIYFAMEEYWDTLHPNFITEERGTVLKRAENSGWGNANYGKFVVPSIGNCVYEWHFEINKIVHGSAMIGMVDVQEMRLNEGLKWNQSVDSYCWYGSRGLLSYKFNQRVQGNTFEDGDIVIMKVDTNQGFIEFSHAKNENAEAKISGKLDLKQADYLSYKMAATIYYKDNYITLTKFEIKQS